jgi:hypothetical protein
MTENQARGKNASILTRACLLVEDLRWIAILLIASILFGGVPFGHLTLGQDGQLGLAMTATPDPVSPGGQVT